MGQYDDLDSLLGKLEKFDSAKPAATERASSPSYDSGSVEQVIRSSAEKYGVDPDVMVGLAMAESSMNPNAKNTESSAGGLFQFIDSTWKQYGGGANKNDPVANAEAAARMLRENLDRFGGDYNAALAAHHVGPGKARAALGDSSIGDVNTSTLDWLAKVNKYAGGKIPNSPEAEYSAAFNNDAPRTDYSSILDYKAPTDTFAQQAAAEEKAINQAAMEKGPTLGDYGRAFGSSAIRGFGDMAQGLVGEPLAWLANVVTGTNDYEGKNLLKGYADQLKEGMTLGGKLASKDSPSGDAFDPSSWKLPETTSGLLMIGADGLGSLVPSIVPFIGQARKAQQLTAAAAQASKVAKTLEAAGDVAKAAEAAKKAAELTALAEKASRTSKIVGAVSGGAMTGGAAAGEIREELGKKMDGMSHEQLLETVPAYRAAFAQTGDQRTSRNMVVDSAAQWGGVLSGSMGAVGGAFNAKILEDVLVKKGVASALGKLSDKAVVRGTVGMGAGAVAEGLQEGSEKVGQNIGENIGRGDAAFDNVGRDAFADMLGGALVGGVMGTGGGALSPHTTKPAQQQPPVQQPNSPLTNAAGLSNHAAQQQAAAADPLAPAIAQISERFGDRALFSAIRENPGLGPDALSDILASYRIATNTNIEQSQRQAAIDRLSQFFSLYDNQPNFTFGGQAQTQDAELPVVAGAGNQRTSQQALPDQSDGAIDGQATRVNEQGSFAKEFNRLTGPAEQAKDNSVEQTTPVTDEQVHSAPNHPSGNSFSVGQMWGKSGRAPYKITRILSDDGRLAEAEDNYGDKFTLHYDAEVANGWSPQGEQVASEPSQMAPQEVQAENAQAEQEPSAAHKTSGRLKPLEDDRVSTHADSLRAMAPDAGWAEEGGKLIRHPDGTKSRTKWVPRSEWFMAGMLNSTEASIAAVEKAINGQPMTAPEKRHVQGMMDFLDSVGAGQQFEGNEESDMAESIGYDEETAENQETIDMMADLIDIETPGTWQDETEAMRALGFTEDEINEVTRGKQASIGGSDEATAEAASGEAEGTVSEGDGYADRQSAGETAQGEGGFDLTGQTNEEAAAEEAAKPNQDDLTKQEIDAQAGAFSLSQESQPKPQGVQTGLFTADGRVSADAKPALVSKRIVGSDGKTVSTVDNARDISVPELPNHKFFTFKKSDGTFSVTEEGTGASVVTGATEEEAIANLKKLAGNVGSAGFDAAISKLKTIDELSSQGTYEQRNADRVERAKNAATQEEFDAITAEEHTDGERHFEGTDRLRMAIDDRKWNLKREAAKKEESDKYEAGEWILVSDHGSRSAADQEAKDAQSKDGASEYRVTIGQGDGWAVQKRKAQTSAEAQREQSKEQIQQSAREAFANGEERKAPEWMAGKSKVYWLTAYDDAKKESEATPFKEGKASKADVMRELAKINEQMPEGYQAADGSTGLELLFNGKIVGNVYGLSRVNGYSELLRIAKKLHAEGAKPMLGAEPTGEAALYSKNAELKHPKTLDEFYGFVDAGYRAHFDYAGADGRTVWIEKTEKGWVLKTVDDDNKGITITKGGAGLGAWDKYDAMKAAEANAEYRFTDWKPVVEENKELSPAEQGAKAFEDGTQRIAPAELSTADKVRWYKGWDKANVSTNGAQEGIAPEHINNEGKPLDHSNKLSGGTYGEVTSLESVDESIVPQTMNADDFKEVINEWAYLIADPEDKTRIDSTVEGEYISKEEAAQRIEGWKQHVDDIYDKHKVDNSQKTVLSLFDLSGEWSKPWEEAGYNVIRFDIQSGQDVMDFSVEYFNENYDFGEVYAILAACPCTDFASSGARWFEEKDADGRTEASKELVFQTMRTIEYFRPKVWAIENPVGRIENLTGLPKWRMSFQPHNFGEDYTKKTLIWGNFNTDLPTANTEPTAGSKMHTQFGGKSVATKNARSKTPEGFAYSFFMANNYHDMPVEQRLTGEYPEASGAIKQALKHGVSEERIHELMEDTYGNYEYEEARNALIQEVAEVTGMTEEEVESESDSTEDAAKNDSEMAKRITIAADSIEKLRKVDVERVLTQGNLDRDAMAAYIKSKRPDLAGEVDGVMAELSDVRIWNETRVPGLKHDTTSSPVRTWRYGLKEFAGTEILPEFPQFFNKELADSLPQDVLEDAQKMIRERLDWYEKEFGIIGDTPLAPSKRSEIEKQEAPGTRINGAKEKAAADKLSALYDEMYNITNRNSREGNAKAAIKSVIEELRKPKTVVSIDAILQKASDDLMKNYGAFSGVIDQVSGELADAPSAPAATAPAHSEDTELQDALSHLGDVLGDVFGAKLNVTGKQYGASDLLPAMSKVIELLIKKGFKSFREAVGAATNAMRGNERTKGFVDQVTQRQWKAAYNSVAEFYEGTESEEEVAKYSAEQIEKIIALPVNIEEAEKTTAVNPTDAQKDAGNYVKGKFQWNGMTVSIETPKGAERSGIGEDGKKWGVTVPVSYGYFNNTVGADKEHLDVYIGDKPESGRVYVINQTKPGSTEFDEHKVMIGFQNEQDAQVSYLLSFEGTFGGSVLGSVAGPYTVEQFKQMVGDGQFKRAEPIADNVAWMNPRMQANESPISLDKFGLKVTRSATRNGTPTWEVSGNTKDHMAVLKNLGGKWYGPKKVWSFYDRVDPSKAIFDALNAKQEAEIVPLNQITVSRNSVVNIGEKSEDQKADEALAELDQQMNFGRQLLECLSA